MPITFPRELPDVGYVTADVVLRDGVTASPAASGLVNYTQVAPPVWEASLTTRPLVMSDFAALEAWWLSLRGGLRSVLFRHPHVCYPRAHWENHRPARTPGRLASIASGNALSIISVDPALILSAGDRIGLEHANRWYVGRVTEASGSGTTRVISVEPPPPSNIAQPGAVVRFDRPGLLMRPVPDSYQATRSGRHYSVSFRLVEVAGVGSVPRDMDFNFTSPLVAAPYFTRASSATYFGTDGLLKTAAINEPRIDHDPVTREPLGLLIEESRTNLLLWSNDFAQSPWRQDFGAGVVVTPAAAMGVDGGMTMSKVAAAATTGQHRIDQLVMTTIGSVHSAQIFAKKGEYSVLYFVLGSHGVMVDLSSGTLSKGDLEMPTSYGISSVGGDIFRIWVTVVSEQELSGVGFLLGNDAGLIFPGDGTSGLYVSDAQFEVGAFPTSYIPTAGAQATRAADVAVVPGAGWLAQNVGTLIAEGSRPATGGVGWPGIASIFSGSSADWIGFFQDEETRGVVALIQEGLATNFTFHAPGPALGETIKMGIAYSRTGTAAACNGGIGDTVEGVSIPQLETLHIGDAYGWRWNGHIKRVTYFPRRLSNAELQEITT